MNNNNRNRKQVIPSERPSCFCFLISSSSSSSSASSSSSSGCVRLCLPVHVRTCQCEKGEISSHSSASLYCNNKVAAAAGAGVIG